MVAIEALVNPDNLSIELALIIGSFVISSLFASIILRSAISMFTWMIMVITLMIIFVTDMSFMFFWITVVLESVALTSSVIVYFLFNDRI